MPKRRRPHEDSKDDIVEHVKRRRRSNLQYDSAELCQELYDTIRSHKDGEGRLVCESFIRVPKRRNSADYYDVIAAPIDLLKIQQKLKTDEYDDVDQMTSDVELMISNAKSYYKKSSQEYRDASQLWDLYISTKSQLLNSMGGKIMKEDDGSDNTDNENSASNEVIRTNNNNNNNQNSLLSSSEDDNPLEDLFAAVMTATDSDGKVLSTSVQLLPSRRRYPDYFKIIQEPMDLKMIATKIQKNKYQNLSNLERDLLLIVKNAKTYNAPGSQIYKDAIALRRVISSKKIEIEHGRATGAKSSERIRARRLAGGQRLSAITAALQYESDGEDASLSQQDDPDDDDEDDDGASDTHDDSNPVCQLFEAVRTQPSSKGYLLSEPFMRKPNRRTHPDYYKEIKNPISLSNIRSKVKNDLYSGVEELIDDLNNMFENAKHYNRAESKIHKDAVKLQKFMQAKSRELINLEKEIESEDDDGSEDKLRRRSRKSLTPFAEERKKMARRVVEIDPVVKKRMKSIYKTLLEYADENGRPLITLFMEKPSKKNYPDYYQIIAEPIDMKTIESNIRLDKYSNEEALLADFHLMFSNCRQYNEEDSQIYRDADTLEKVLMDKIQESHVEPPKIKVIAKKSKAKVSPVVAQKLQTLFETIRDYSDKGRKLSTIFMKLPSRVEYPDYYEVIKRPMDMMRIQARMNGGHFESLEEMLSEFALMFDNACKYNEPDSQIYKDALTLQRVVLQTKAELSEDGDGNIPDVRPLVQELLTSMFTYVYNHQDEEGRCFVDSLAELSETRATDADGTSKFLTLDVIKRNLDKGRYKRLDTFQDDIFEVFETARRISRTDSQVFEDSVELQVYFIKMRDDLCKSGEVLLSPALRYTEKEMQQGVENVRLEKLPKEKIDDEKEKEQDGSAEKEQRSSQNNSDSVDYHETTYHVGDFVYIEPREKGLEPHIIHIEKLWKDEQGEQWLYGCWFYRPNETFHLATRKFLEKEVFKSDNYNSAPMNQVLGKCYVMFVKDYFKYQPEGFEDKDIYVCESRYSAKAKAFKKIKAWPTSTMQRVRVILRAVALIPTRVPSVFKERFERHKEDSMDIDDIACKVVEKEKPNVLYPDAPSDENLVYYEQFNLPGGRYKIGDCVYVLSENGRQLIARIDKIWEDNTKKAFFHGPWFVTPLEIAHPPTRLFHKQEVFLSSIEDANPLLSVTGRCYVMELRDYVRCRPTEIPEKDIFVCESRYLEAERQIRKITKGLKKFIYSDMVVEDEIYFFKKPITAQKTEANGSPQVHAVKPKILTCSEPSPLLPKTSDAEMEDSLDGHTPSVGSVETPVQSQTVSAKKKPVRRLVTGYILYAGEVRKSIITKNPDSSFGDISRMVGTEWRTLPTDLKAEYEEKAQKINEETAANQPKEEVVVVPPSVENMVYECLWDKCDYQFESQQDLLDHLIAEQTGHVQQKYNTQECQEAGEFQCVWHNCTRVKKNVAPFQNLQRLLRHCREVHVKASGKCILPADRGKNFFPSLRPANQNQPLTPVQGYSSSRYSHMSGFPNSASVSNQSLYPSLAPQLAYMPSGLLRNNCLACMPTVHSQCGQRTEFPIHHHDIPSMLDLICEPDAGQHAGQFGPSSSKSADPLFVVTPPKPKKLLHSEAYLRYIEGLQPDSKTISNWDSNLKATQESSQVADAARLPVHWLGNGVGNHGNAVNALWALRDYMLKDALNISKILW